MADEIDPERLDRARWALVVWMNERAFDHDPILDTDALDDWEVWPVGEFLVFSSPGGYTNRLYLVGDEIVRTFTLAEETVEYAIAAARAGRDGTPPPAPLQPVFGQENWNL